MKKDINMKQSQISPCSPYDLRSVTDNEGSTFLIQTSLIITARNSTLTKEETVVELITGETLRLSMPVSEFIDALNLKYPYGIPPEK
ncbi:hypothetical protein RN616_19710 (plasmid) [Morganella morganii]|uniref:hypothetical protein n=1 Tax=Morganella morganii TaxID=582 RepID=UPI0028D2F7C7|nr:hypothetical protein [Morganella morganii]WNP32633.1 hypothetical protein RN616_19710 [Morganella morganii]